MTFTCVEMKRDDGVSARTASKSKKRPPTTSSDGHDARRWRKGSRTPRPRVLVVEGVGALAAPHALRVARGEAQAALRALVSGGAERAVDAVPYTSFCGVGQYFSDARRGATQMIPELRDALLLRDAHAAEAL